MNSQKTVDWIVIICQNRCTETTDTQLIGAKEPQPAQAGLIQASSFSKTDPARERADIPQVARAVGLYPQRGAMRRVVQWQLHDPPFLHSAPHVVARVSG